VLLGLRSLAGLGPVRKWVALGTRLGVLLLFVLILGGIRWQRQNKDVEVIALRDISESTNQVRNYPGKSLQLAVDDYLTATSDEKRGKKPADRIGVISFKEDALIDVPPENRLILNANAIRDPGSGTDVASAIQLALATFHKDAMHRLLLMWDGNATTGDTESAIAAAKSQGVPIDVMPLKYDVSNEVLVDRFVAPTWKRENEPFTMDLILRSTNLAPVAGTLTVRHGGELMDLDPNTPGMQSGRRITLKNGLNVEHVYVPALGSSGPHQFHASFEPDNLVAGAATRPGGSAPGGAGASGVTVMGAQGDTLLQNNSAETFTFVQGKGQVLYIDNVPDGRGNMLRQALVSERINVDNTRTTVDQFPASIVDLQKYDAVILANVPRGIGGLSEDQQKMLATYVHDMGGGLVMIGGEQSFGAGGWGGSKLEEVLPVNMDIPAQRQIPKGALVLVMHAIEMPNGMYWAEQCALKAGETLSARDEIGVISFGPGRSQWDFPLQEKGDGSRFTSAVKAMQMGDMPSFDDSIGVALNGLPGQPGLLKSDARQRHIIVISDGDPAMPADDLVRACQKNQISISTVTIFTHTPGTRSPQMDNMARLTKGKAYGPIESNPNQLPQIFIKEATVVRRSLIQEDNKGIPVKTVPSTSDIARGLEAGVPPLFGYVITTKKNNPQVELPLVAGKQNDPVLAFWQTGLGKSAAFTSDAHNRWASQWAASGMYERFWAQVIRSVSRPAMSPDFEVTTSQTNDGKGKIVVEALNKDSTFLNFLSVNASVVGPTAGQKPDQVRLVQTGPGRYEGEFDARDPGAYCAVVNYRGAKADQAGYTLSGMVVNTSPELRELRSNDPLLLQVAERTGGRVLPPWDPAGAELFTRDGLTQTASPLPIWDILLPILMALILTDVAVRRIAWDWNATKRLAASSADYVRSFTTTRRVETRGSIDALKGVREKVAETGYGAAAKPESGAVDQAAGKSEAVPRPDPRAKFEAKATVEGDITKVVGGATDKPVPPPPKKIEPKGGTGGAGASMSSLMAAKRRAQEQIKQKEQEGGQQ
jgi:uncharacterized membrane protein/Mg-chelatase subunit ChlD